MKTFSADSAFIGVERSKDVKFSLVLHLFDPAVDQLPFVSFQRTPVKDNHNLDGSANQSSCYRVLY